MYSVPSSEAVAAQLTTEGYNAPSDLQLSIENLAHTNTQIISELKDILSMISEYRKRNNIVRTVGTTVGVSGAVALCAAPFTGGFSAPVAIGGIVASGASAVTSIGSSFAYKRKHQQITQNLETLQQQQQLAAQELTLKLNIINSVVEEIVASAGVDEGTALRSTLYHISRKTVRLVITGYDIVIKDTVIGQQISQQMNRLRDLAVGIIMTKGFHPKDILHEISHPVVNAAVQLGQVAGRELKEFRVLVKNSAQSMRGAVSGRTILHGVGAAVGVIFSVIDVALLIRDWKNPDPMTATITGVIKDLENDIGKCADILNLLKNCQAHIEPAEGMDQAVQTIDRHFDQDSGLHHDRTPDSDQSQDSNDGEDSGLQPETIERRTLPIS